MLAGFRYIFSNKVVLGAISLDLFAVLMGGAVALLPIYARDILHAGPAELGYLRAAPGIGAIVMAVILSRFPIRDHAGKLAVPVRRPVRLPSPCIFGLSTSIWLLGDRPWRWSAPPTWSASPSAKRIMQLWTPEEVRGRVNAVNSVFIGASNELGEFRAGTVAHLIGPVPAVVLGGIGSIIVAGAWAVMFLEPPQPALAQQEDGRGPVATGRRPRSAVPAHPPVGWPATVSRGAVVRGNPVDLLAGGERDLLLLRRGVLEVAQHHEYSRRYRGWPGSCS